MRIGFKVLSCRGIARILQVGAVARVWAAARLGSKAFPGAATAVQLNAVADDSDGSSLAMLRVAVSDRQHPGR